MEYAVFLQKVVFPSTEESVFDYFPGRILILGVCGNTPSLQSPAGKRACPLGLQAEEPHPRFFFHIFLTGCNLLRDPG